MNVVDRQEPGGFATHEVNPSTARVWHRRKVRSRSKRNLRQTPVLQAETPDVPQPDDVPAEQYGISRFGPHTLIWIPRYLPQVNSLMAGQVYSIKTEILFVVPKTSSKQVVAAGK